MDFASNSELKFLRGIPFQDAAKAGLQFGDEGEFIKVESITHTV